MDIIGGGDPYNIFREPPPPTTKVKLMDSFGQQTCPCYCRGKGSYRDDDDMNSTITQKQTKDIVFAFKYCI